MSAGSSLQNWGGLTVDQKLNALRNALRGGPAVLDAQGAPSDGTTDFGSAANTIRRLYAENLRIGAVDVDIRPLADATPGYAFDASADFDWPYDGISKALVWMVSAESGSGGGGAANATDDDPDSDLVRGRGGEGGDGGESTVEFGSTTLTSGGAFGGKGGLGGQRQTPDLQPAVATLWRYVAFLISDNFFAPSAGASQSGGAGGLPLSAENDREFGHDGGRSRQVAGYGVLTGLSLNDTITVTVSVVKGAAGTGGTFSGENPGLAGRDGQADGLVIIWPLR